MKKSTLSFFALLAFAMFQFSFCKSNEGLPLGELPPAVKSYVEANYPAYSIDEAEMEADCFGASVYEVEIEQNEDNELELVFDKNGNFLYSETEIAVSDLPAAVSGSIASKFAGFKTKEADKLAMADGSTRFEVEMKKDGKTKEVIFDTEGTVICEQDE